MTLALDPEMFRSLWVKGSLLSTNAALMRPLDQSLILPEIIACLRGCRTVFLPFFEPYTAAVLRGMGIAIVADESERHWTGVVPDGCEAMYFGTPTIVNGKSLDHRFDDWNKAHERQHVRTLCQQAEQRGYGTIVSGLGSGDISSIERMQDMGGAKVVAWKDFGEFSDIVFLRRIRQWDAQSSLPGLEG